MYLEFLKSKLPNQWHLALTLKLINSIASIFIQVLYNLMKIILSSSISTYHLMVRRRNHPPNKACFANSWKWTWTTRAASKYDFNYSIAFQLHEHFWIEFSDVLYQSEQSAHQPGLPVQQGQPDQAADVHQGPICDTDHEAGKNYGDVVCWKRRRKS